VNSGSQSIQNNELHHLSEERLDLASSTALYTVEKKPRKAHIRKKHFPPKKKKIAIQRKKKKMPEEEDKGPIGPIGPIIVSLDDEDSSERGFVIGTKYTITKKQARLSKYFTTYFESDKGEEKEDIYLKTHDGKNIVEPEVFDEVMKYLKHHDGITPSEIEVPFTHTDMSGAVSQWDAEFIDAVCCLPPNDPELIYKIIYAASYFSIDSLLELACAKIASVIKKSRTVSEIRNELGIETNDETKEHQKKVFAEYDWMCL
jgi:S-phase kinase-associated protein 1